MVPHSERLNVRYAAPTDCIVVSEAGRRLVGDRALDLSWDGARVRGDGRSRLGERVRLELRVPDSNLWIDAFGVVARVMPGRRDGDVPGVGLRITRMDGMSRILLASVLRAYPLAAPTRRYGRDYASIVARVAAGA